MTEIDAEKIYSSFGQKVARILHYVKVKYRNKEKKMFTLCLGCSEKTQQYLILAQI